MTTPHLQTLAAKAAEQTRKSKHRWISCKTRMPRNNQRVLARYVGVHGPTVVTYWFDGVNHHFGNPPESEPATHWRKL